MSGRAHGRSWAVGALTLAEAPRQANKTRVGSKRIGVLALQRLGDVLTAARVTAGLAGRIDVGAVELIHFEGTRGAAELLPGVSALHALPRARLRMRSRAHPLAALTVLRAHVEALRERRFDELVNLSTTGFACALAPALIATSQPIHGGRIQENGEFAASHAAIEHLNAWESDPELGVFAHQDLYAAAAGLAEAPRPVLAVDPHAAARVARILEACGGAPIAMHIRSSDLAKDWRPTLADDGWLGLIRALQRRFSRPVVLLGSAAETAEMNPLAAATGSHVATGPLRETAELLRGACGLVSVDTVAIHLAATVRCPTLVLRRGPARGLAFVPGSVALLVDPRGPTCGPEVDDVVRLCGAHFFGEQLELAAATELISRLLVRQGSIDAAGYLGAAVPAWLPSTGHDEEQDRHEALWRELWRSDWDGPGPSDRVAAALSVGRSPVARHRFAQAFASATPVGAWLRDWAHDQRRVA